MLPVIKVPLEDETVLENIYCSRRGRRKPRRTNVLLNPLSFPLFGASRMANGVIADADGAAPAPLLPRRIESDDR